MIFMTPHAIVFNTAVLVLPHVTSSDVRDESIYRSEMQSYEFRCRSSEYGVV